VQAAKFGAFELDMAARELRKGGMRVGLQQQPFQVLVFLVERSGEVVTRDELRKALWPADTFVDFDKSLNTAVKKVRTALNDPAASSRFVETLPKVGYRFVAPVQRIEAGGSGPFPGPANPEPRSPPPEPQLGEPWPIAWLGMGLLATAAVLLLTVNVGIQRSSGTPTVLHPIPLTSYPGVEIHPAFSPDSDRIAFAWSGEKNDNYDIYVKDINSRRLLRLTWDAAEDTGPAWSPDGRWIAFVRRAATGAEVHLVSAHGGPARKISELGLAGRRLLGVHDVLSADSGPYLCWSADGKSIIVPDREHDSAARGLYVVSVGTGEKRRVTQSSTVDSQPALSPDGRTLAFVRARGLAISDIYILPVSAQMEPRGQPRKLTFGDASIQGLAWSRDGSEVFFVSGGMMGRRSLLRIALGGSSRPKPVPIPSESISSPAVAPTSPLLAYSHESVDRNIWRLKLTGAGTAGRPELLIASTYLEKQPHFSPDGKKIVFASSRSGTEEIWISDADGSNSRQITNFKGMPVGSPRWSPDGTQIAFDGFPQGLGEIYVVSSTPGSALRLTNNDHHDMSPSWSRDGRWIYFVSERGADRQVWKMRADLPGPAAAIQVTKGGATFGPFESPDGKLVYYLKKGELWKVPSQGGDELKVLGTLSRLGGYALAANGIYFLSHDSRGSTVDFLPFASGRLNKLLSVQKQIYHLSVSPTGDWLLYTQPDQESADLMLVEHFR